MIAAEFDRWWADFTERWPDMGEWFADGRSADVQARILRNWSQALADVSLAEALAVNRGMYAGDLVGFTGRWDRDRVPAIVRQHAISARPAATTWTGPNDDPHLDQGAERPPKLNGVLHRLIEMRDAGADDASCRAFLAQEFPPEPRERQRRYVCITCFDSGRIEVWHHERVYLAATKGIEAGLQSLYRTSTAACACQAGQMFASRKIPLQRFDSQLHCLAAGGDVTSPRAIALFTDWLQARRDVKRRPNYERAFEDFNEPKRNTEGE